MQTVYKAGQVLNLFAVERPEWRVGEVSEALAFPKSSTSELMSALAEQGFLRRTDSRRYKLGWRIMAMSQILLQTTEFRAEARFGMEQLVSRFGETVHLAALERGQVIYVDKLQGTKAVQIAITAVGNKFSAHASGVGKVLLAYRPWEEVVVILEREGMVPMTPNTITTLEGFWQELDDVRKQGFAYDIEEGLPDIRCVAAPIRDHTGEVVASMSFTVPAYRFVPSEERYRCALLQTVEEVSRNLGYFGSQRFTHRENKEMTNARI